MTTITRTMLIAALLVNVSAYATDCKGSLHTGGASWCHEAYGKKNSCNHHYLEIGRAHV